MSFKFGERSERELKGVHPDLVDVVRRALELSPIDFAVTDGLRTEAEQAEYVRTGASKTMKSKHLVQHDGYSHAVDLVPFVNGKPRWEMPVIFQVIRAVKDAAGEKGLSLTWGCVWDRPLAELGDNLAAAVHEYQQRREAIGARAFVDGPHIEMRAS